MASLVERLRVRSDRRPIYTLDESDEEADFVKKKSGSSDNFERIQRPDAVILPASSRRYLMHFHVSLRLSPIFCIFVVSLRYIYCYISVYMCLCVCMYTCIHACFTLMYQCWPMPCIFPQTSSLRSWQELLFPLFFRPVDMKIAEDWKIGLLPDVPLPSHTNLLFKQSDLYHIIGNNIRWDISTKKKSIIWDRSLDAMNYYVKFMVLQPPKSFVLCWWLKLRHV